MSARTYAKAALPLLPGASRLPFVAGHGSEVPERERVRADVRVNVDHLAAYARVCGFGLRDELPPTYPHVVAFPLHMQLMTDGSFPFAPIGLIHIANRIAVRRPLRVGESFDVRVRATPAEPHPRGRTFGIVSEAWVGDDLVWEELSTILRRGGGSGEAPKRGRKAEPPPAAVQWRLPGDLGRRYAAVSGDHNPIHLHWTTARLFGFPRAIAHGMWTKAHALAALAPSLPDAFTVEVEFRKPILVPATVAFGTRVQRRATIFAVRATSDEYVVHLEGRVTT